MGKRKVTLPQIGIVLVILAIYFGVMWWRFLGPGGEPPPKRLSAPFPGEEERMKMANPGSKPDKAPQKPAAKSPMLPPAAGSEKAASDAL